MLSPAYFLRTFQSEETVNHLLTNELIHKIKIEVIKAVPEDYQSFDNFRDFVDMAFSAKTIETNVAAAINHINVESSRIAKITRRGRGNKLIVGPNDRIFSASSAWYTYDVSINPSLKPNEVLVMYSGSNQLIDAGAAWHETDTGKINAVIMRETSTHLHSSRDYGTLITFNFTD